MTGISTAVTVLSCSLFAASLIKMLAPHGSTEKILRLVISLFVLISVVTCFKSVADSVNIAEFQSSDATENSEQINSTVEQSVLKVTGDYMAEYVQSLLLSEKISADEIYVTVNADDNSVINITDISIYIDKSKSILKSKITDIIEKDLDIIPKVVVKE